MKFNADSYREFDKYCCIAGNEDGAIFKVKMPTREEAEIELLKKLLQLGDKNNVLINCDLGMFYTKASKEFAENNSIEINRNTNGRQKFVERLLKIRGAV